MILWLASYPRSGNTFVRVLLNTKFGLGSYSLYNDLNDIAADSATSKVVGHKVLHSDFSIAAARAKEEICLVKTHGPPPASDDLAIYIIRDGRECIWSYHRYLLDFWDNEISVNDIINGKVQFGSWSEHVESWSPLNRPNTLLLRYECLVEQPEVAASQIATFLGREPSSQMPASFEELNRINPKMFRAGQKREWATHFTPYQRRRFWQKHGRVMEAYNYDR